VRAPIALLIAAACCLAACKRSEPHAAPDAAVAPRPRPAAIAHITLKVLGMT
jgi:hypothetical protein